MKWVVIQLTPWAEKYLKTEELVRELRRKLKLSDLQYYYAVFEDVVGKHITPYSEYFFVEFREGVLYLDLEGTDAFRRILKDAKGQFQFLEDADLEVIKCKTKQELVLRPGETARIYYGPLTGTVGEVVNDTGTQVSMDIFVGDVPQHAVIPRHWCRRVKRKHT
jgi:hypothetical protein